MARDNIMSKMQLILFITAIMVTGAFIVPSCAQIVISAPANQTDNVTYVPVSGNVTFDPDNYNNVKSVTELTIYARSAAGIDTMANPTADGKFSMSVPGSGNYSFWVYPSKLDYLNKATNATYSVKYPDMSSPYYQNVTEAGLSNIVMPTTVIQTGKPMNATPVPPTVPPTATATPLPSPGFSMLAVLAALGVVAAIAYRKK